MSLLTRLIATGVDMSAVRGLSSERLTDIERHQFRIANAVEFLSAAFNRKLPPYPRMLCAFESAYLCCVEIVETSELLSETASHPSPSVVNVAASTLRLNKEEKRTLGELTEWASSYPPFMPLIEIENACASAREVVLRTIQYFA